MKALTTYIVCLFWILAPLAQLRAIPLSAFLSGSPSAGGGGGGGGTTYTLVDSLTGTTSGSYTPGNSGLNADAYAVEFTPSTSYTIVKVVLPLSKTGAPTQNYTCEIWTQSTSLPAALVGSASAAVNGSTFAASETDVEFFPTAAVTSGTPYYVVLRASARDASNYANWHRVTTAGRIDVYNAAGPAWTNASTTRRCKFKTYSTP